MFLYSFEKMMIDKLVEYNLKDPVVGTQKLLEIAFRFQDRNLFEQLLARGLNSSISKGSTSFGFEVGTTE